MIVFLIVVYLRCTMLVSIGGIDVIVSYICYFCSLCVNLYPQGLPLLVALSMVVNQSWMTNCRSVISLCFLYDCGLHAIEVAVFCLLTFSVRGLRLTIVQRLVWLVLYSWNVNLVNCGS